MARRDIVDEDTAGQPTEIGNEGGPDLVALPAGAELPGQPLRYVGAGEYIYGVPARDLSADEAALFAAQIAAVAAATGRVLYAPSQE